MFQGSDNIVVNRHQVPSSRNCQSVPRAGVVNARRPGHGPGRSEAESVDDPEHGASITSAMVVPFDVAVELSSAVPQDGLPLRTYSCQAGPHTSAVRCGRATVPAAGAILLHELGAEAATSGTTNDGVNDPRQGSLGSGAGHGGGVVHAIVGVVTSARALLFEAAESAASRS